MVKRKSFGEQLKYWRERRGWSQSTLASHAGYDNSYISMLEASKKMPTRNAVGKLAEALALTKEQALPFYTSARMYPPDVDGLMLADCDPAVITLHELLEQMPDHAASEYSHAMRMLFATYRYETTRWQDFTTSSE